MLLGIVVKPLKRTSDDRGFFVEVFRKDWKDILENQFAVQANHSVTSPGIIRAWHRLSLVKIRTMVKKKVHAITDKYGLYCQKINAYLIEH